MSSLPPNTDPHPAIPPSATPAGYRYGDHIPTATSSQQGGSGRIVFHTEAISSIASPTTLPTPASTVSNVSPYGPSSRSSLLNSVSDTSTSSADSTGNDNGGTGSSIAMVPLSGPAGAPLPAPLPPVSHSMMHLWSRGDPTVVSVGPAVRTVPSHTHVGQHIGTPTSTYRGSSGSTSSSGANGARWGPSRDAPASLPAPLPHVTSSMPSPMRKQSNNPAAGVSRGAAPPGKLTFSPPSAATFTTPQRVMGPARSPQQYAEIIEKAKRAGSENTRAENHKGCVFSCMDDPWKAVKLTMAFLFVCIGVGIAVYIYLNLRGKELATWQDKYHYQCQQRAQQLESQLNVGRIQMNAYAAYATASVLFSNSSVKTFTAEQFETFGDISRSNSSYLDLVLWIRLVAAENRVAWEAEHGTAIWQLNATPTNRGWNDNQTIAEIPALPHTEYLPIQYQNPDILFFDGNATGRFPGSPSIPYTLVGWDLDSLAGNPYNITKIAESGRQLAGSRSAALTGPNGNGIQTYAPVFSTPTIPPIELRRQLCQGFILGIIPVQPLLKIISSSLTEQISMRVMDITGGVETFLAELTPSQLPFYTASTEMDQSQNYTIPLKFLERSYQLTCSPSVAEVNTAYSTFPLFLAVGTGVLFFVNLLVLALGSSCLDLRKALRRQDALASANESKLLALKLLEEARAEADNANRSKSDFMAFLCHELRNPLHAIVSMIEFLGAASNRMGQDDMDCVHTIRASVSMMRSIVNDALDMTKIESGNIEFESVPFSLRDVVQTLVRVERGQAQAKGLELIETIDPLVPRALLGDPTRIRQVLINFISNAIKFTKHGSVNLSLRMMSAAEAHENGLYVFTCDAHDTEAGATGVPATGKGSPPQSHRSTSTTSSPTLTSPKAISTKKSSDDTLTTSVAPKGATSIIIHDTSTGMDPKEGKADHLTVNIDNLVSPAAIPPSESTIPSAKFPNGWVALELRVTDTGMGIEPNLLPRLFEPYSQAKLSIMRDHGGTGLGLAIVSRIVSMMGGRVFVESHLGQGSSFIAQIALAVAPPDSHLVLPGTANNHMTPTHTPTPTETPPTKPSPLITSRPISYATIGNGSGSSGDEGVTLNMIGLHHSHGNGRQSGTTTPPSVRRSNRAAAAAAAAGDDIMGPLPGSPLARVRSATPGGTSNSSSLSNEAKRLGMHAAVSMRLMELTNSGQLSKDNGNSSGHDSSNESSPARSSRTFAFDMVNTASQANNDSPLQTSSNGVNSGGSMTALRVMEAQDGLTSNHSSDSSNDSIAATSDLALGIVPMSPQIGINNDSQAELFTPVPSSTPVPSNSSLDDPNRIGEGVSHQQLSGGSPGSLPLRVRPRPPLQSLVGGSAIPAALRGSSRRAQTSTTRAEVLAAAAAANVHDGDTNGSTTSLTSLTSLSSSSSAAVAAANGAAAAAAAAAEDAATIQQRKMRRVQAQAQAQAKQEADKVLQKYGPRLLLVVDDAPVNVKILVKMLGGLDCVTATNGLEAVEAVRRLALEGLQNGTRRQFDIVLTDVIMPLMDGIQAAGAIRKLEVEVGLPPVPIVAITANAMSQDKQRCLEAGMTFLSKPFVREDIFRLLDNTLLGVSSVTATSTPLGGTPVTGSPSLHSISLGGPSAAGNPTTLDIASSTSGSSSVTARGTPSITSRGVNYAQQQAAPPTSNSPSSTTRSLRLSSSYTNVAAVAAANNNTNNGSSTGSQ